MEAQGERRGRWPDHVTSAPLDSKLHFLEIDAELASAARSGAAAFSERFGVRVPDFDFVRENWIEANIAHLARVPRPSPFRAYLAVETATGEVVGTCAFVTGPMEREVEIAYGTSPAHEGRGVAKAMARELVRLARESGDVDIVFANTLREPNASTRVLQAVGFGGRRAVDHAEDGPIWRWDFSLRD